MTIRLIQSITAFNLIYFRNLQDNKLEELGPSNLDGLIAVKM